jgi:hypothetical protein
MVGNRLSRSIRTVAVVAGLALFLGAQPSQAAVSVFMTPTGATTSGGAVNATAVFTSSAGQLSITLTNLQANPLSVAQTISDIDQVTLSNGNFTGATSNSLTATVNLITINSGGSVTPNGPGPAGWVFSTQSSTVATLDVLNGPGHAGPANEIIGPGPYTNANGSIAGNGPHNPFIDQTATFTISGAGISANTVVTSMRFSFGTGPEFVDGVPGTVVPEPSTMALALSGLGAIGLAVRRRKARSAVV